MKNLIFHINEVLGKRKRPLFVVLVPMMHTHMADFTETFSLIGVDLSIRTNWTGSLSPS
jgi:hypothetical protein